MIRSDTEASCDIEGHAQQEAAHADARIALRLAEVRCGLLELRLRIAEEELERLRAALHAANATPRVVGREGRVAAW